MINRDELKAISETLKKYNKPDGFYDSGTPEGRKRNLEFLDNCYIDPLKGNEVLRSLMSQNHAFLVGRKGTGKSTIFLKSQVESQKNNNLLTSYIDVRDLFENVKRKLTYSVDNISTLSITNKAELLTLFVSRVLKKVFSAIVYKYSDDFLSPIISETKKNKLDKIQPDLKTIISDYLDLEIEDVKDLIKGVDNTEEKDLFPFVCSKLNVVTILDQIRTIFYREKINSLHLYIDDFNELPVLVQKCLLFIILETFYHRTDRMFIFKVAKYPGMVDYGSIDRSKIETIYLDFHDLYSAHHKDFISRAQFAKDKIEELLNKRCQYLYSKTFDKYISKGEYNDFIDKLFEISLGIPRYIGWLLDYSTKYLNKDNTVSISSLEKASKSYYLSYIETLLQKTAILQKPHRFKKDVYNIIELLAKIVEEIRILKSKISIRYKKYSKLKNPPASHFYVNKTYELVFELLELNLFVNKYREAKNKSSNQVTIFSLNHGLCAKFGIPFGRPLGKEYRDYQIETVFDMSNIVKEHLMSSVKYKCDICNSEINEEAYKVISQFGYTCLKCKKGEVTRIVESPLSVLIKNRCTTLELLDEPSVELLFSLKEKDITEKPVYKIAEETNYSYQLLGFKNKYLISKGLTSKEDKYDSVKGSKRVFYSLKDKAHEIFKDPVKLEELVNDYEKLEYEYDVAISFASENRNVALDIAKECKNRGFNIFYDEKARAKLWGKDLYQDLYQIYSKKSQYCLIIISKHYPDKDWTKHELKAAQERDFKSQEEYILPLRLDDTEIKGLRSTVGYITYNDDEHEIVDLIQAKLNK
ncbi:MAG: TIR domain-containing protein [Candidatus Aureabacteria bacterium]|nr:TIR domain-containing protein [Candidatus Auribacterota bacterium]